MATTLLIDTSYLIYRSYFAYPKLSQQDFPTGAFFGFAKAILTFVDVYSPEQIIFALDTAKPTWRHEILDSYKADRPPIQEEMVVQIPVIQDWIKKISKNYLSMDGFEADDFIHTSCHKILGIDSTTDRQNQSISDQEILIFSSDRDLYQLLIYPQVKFIQAKTMKDGWQLFGKEEFIAKYDLQPEQWLDYKTLVGDASDNLKGISGVGPKTATNILHKIGCLGILFEILEIATDFKIPSVVNTTEFKDSAKMFAADPKNQDLIQKIKDNLVLLEQTYLLATLQLVPNTTLDNHVYDLKSGVEDFVKYGFKSLVSQTEKISARQFENTEPDALF